MLKGKQRELAELLEQYIRRYEVLLERLYNVGEILTRDETQWMHDFNNPERQVLGIYYKLRRIDDPYVDMILNKFDSLRRKEHGLKMVQKIRESALLGQAEKKLKKEEENLESFFEYQHKDTDRLLNDLVLAIHKKSGGINATAMDRFITQIRKKVEKIKTTDKNAVVEIKAAINRRTNQIEITVEPIDDELQD